MSIEENKKTVETMWAALSDMNWETLKSCLSDDIHYEDVPTEDPGARERPGGTPEVISEVIFGVVLDVASDFPRGSLGQRVRIDFRSIFGSFAQGPTLV